MGNVLLLNRTHQAIASALGESEANTASLAARLHRFERFTGSIVRKRQKVAIHDCVVRVNIAQGRHSAHCGTSRVRVVPQLRAGMGSSMSEIEQHTCPVCGTVHILLRYDLLTYSRGCIRCQNCKRELVTWRGAHAYSLIETEPEGRTSPVAADERC